MNHIGRKIFFAVLLLLAAAALAQEEPAEIQVLAPGERFTVGEGITGEWEFSQRPQIGTVILKIQLFDKNDERISNVAISGRSGMPSMPGHHDSGDVPFKLNRKLNYLLPVSVVMPGEWEVQLTFRDGETVLRRAAIRFDV